MKEKVMKLLLESKILKFVQLNYGYINVNGNIPNFNIVVGLSENLTFVYLNLMMGNISLLLIRVHINSVSPFSRDNICLK